ncbi:MAG: cell division topological specificity factor MinE [Clostridiales bacterium]|jgi:cell division topological specificity factor|nr:cell division topological specificity factor MinE [Clostridiales bacterium]
MFDLSSLTSKIFGRKNASKDVAKGRLKLVLIHDKANVNSDLLKIIKSEIMQVLMKYTDATNEDIDIHITSTESEDGEGFVPALTANIPIKNMKKPNEETA